MAEIAENGFYFAVNGCKWQEWLKMAENAGNGLEWPEIAGNG